MWGTSRIVYCGCRSGLPAKRLAMRPSRDFLDMVMRSYRHEGGEGVENEVVWGGVRLECLLLISERVLNDVRDVLIWMEKLLNVVRSCVLCTTDCTVFYVEIFGCV